jgi:hypothetical protein
MQADDQVAEWPVRWEEGVLTDRPRRHGRKRALVAVGHTLLVSTYHVLKRGTTCAELGADFLERLEPDQLTRHLVKRLEKLGHNVILQPKEDAA